MTPEDYRRIALSFPAATESSHMDHPDFRVGGKIFATLWKGDGVVMLSPEQQAQLVKSNAGVLFPVKGGWGRKGATTVRLGGADESLVRMALSMAYQRRVSKSD
ncbi:MAG TPA: MmcQ/YjbR family DNA-binding protein [Nitrososphaerales archaeon]|nr:MmcQ/YjbR family DNA-binding protein [Nitrososphaerales archaeon]